MATRVPGGYNPAAVAITGGAIDNTPIGATTPSTGSFTAGQFVNGSFTVTFASGNGINIATASAGSPNIRLSQAGVANWTITNTATTGALAIAGGTAASINAVLTAASGTATPAGGSTSAALLMGTTAGFGIYYGSGAPTVSAAQGSLFLRSDGSSTSTRAYINSSSGSGTTWTAITTAT